MMEILEDERDAALGQISQKESEIAQLTDSLNEAEERIGLLITQLHFSVGGCPEDNPGNKLNIGFDDGSSGGVQGDGILSGGEIVSTIGECPGGSGKIFTLPSASSMIYNSMVTMGGNLYFVADDGSSGEELWRSDGTLGGTYMVSDITPAACDTCLNPGTDFGEIVAGDNKIFFSAAAGTDPIRELYVSDGTHTGTQKITETFECVTGLSATYPEFTYTGVNSITVVPASEVGFDTAYFSAFQCSYERFVCAGEEPHFSDGTEQGTYQLIDLKSGSTDLASPGGGSVVADLEGSKPSDFMKVGNRIFFSADSDQGATTSNVGRELFSLDLSSLFGTVSLVKDINEGSQDSSPSSFEAMGGTLFFTADDGISGTELWKSDGTYAGTTIVSNIAANESDSWPQELVAIGNELFFSATDGNSGHELWKSDGTYSGTTLVKDIRPGVMGSGLMRLTAMGGKLFFPASDGIHGNEMWMSDGTESGTVMIADIQSGNIGSYPTVLTPMGDKLYFAAGGNSSIGYELYSYEIDSGAGTLTLAEDINEGAQSGSPMKLVPIGNKLFLVADDGSGWGFQLRYHWENPGPVIG